MIIAVPYHNWTSSGRIYGHVGIYIGDGLVMDSLYYVRTVSLDAWIAEYSGMAEVRWGWAL
jgi:cell wall-associated NlpC family hydrolase